ncbi:MAG: 4Fe-4S binding protein [Alitiscatomonas sp.]
MWTPNLHLVTEISGTHRSDFLGGDKAVWTRKCTGCGLCQAHCRFDAISRTDGVYAISEYACEGCGVCAHVCPSKAIRLAPDTAGRKELYTDGGVFSTAVLKMGRGNSGKLVTEVKMAMLKHAPETDLAIVDGSPGIGCPVISSVSGMDLVWWWLSPAAQAQRSGTAGENRRNLPTKLAVCVNKWDVSPEYTRAIQEFCVEKGIPFAGTVPYDHHASEAINQGKSLADIDCPARDALKKIFDTVCRLL